MPPPPFRSDALSGILDDLRIRTGAAELSSRTAPWEMQRPRGSAIFYAVRLGEMVLEIDGSEDLVLQQGDLAVVMHGSPHRISDRSQSSAALHSTGHGEATHFVAVELFYNLRHSPMLEALPPVIVMRAGSAQPAPWLDSTLDQILRETQLHRPGFEAVVDHLAKIIFIQAVRCFIADSPGSSHAFIAALADGHIAKSLCLIHHACSDPWTVASLARRVGLSRSVFAQKFSTLVGQSPMAYLLNHRMIQASSLLGQSDMGLKYIAAQVGYGSEAAFSSAFKRWSGTSPGQFRRRK